ncbi:MAG: GDSL-type esterase/lipase family protein [Rubrivivax sp.]|jgi:hypothetical protein|nr:GDSL-type esterase/lipase family protein [Rubrivivax sp.]
MPIGTITEGGYGGFRWSQLASAGWRTLSHVSPMRGGQASADPDHAAIGGHKVRVIMRPAGSGSWDGRRWADQRDLSVWFHAYASDVVLVHSGTNDAWGGADPASVLAAYSAILNYARTRNPNVTFVIAQIIPMFPAGCGNGRC